MTGEAFDLKSGTPQGSVISPKLYSSHIPPPIHSSNYNNVIRLGLTLTCRSIITHANERVKLAKIVQPKCKRFSGCEEK